jgi:hypothetical protein
MEPKQNNSRVVQMNLFLGVEMPRLMKLQKDVSLILNKKVYYMLLDFPVLNTVNN